LNKFFVLSLLQFVYSIAFLKATPFLQTLENSFIIPADKKPKEIVICINLKDHPFIYSCFEKIIESSDRAAPELIKNKDHRTTFAITSPPEDKIGDILLCKDRRQNIKINKEKFVKRPIIANTPLI
jgi:hypothetical protein